MKKVYTHAVIGAGIVGLSVALKLQSLGNNVLVLDKETSPGKHQSGRNSGVIHSGIYYKPNSCLLYTSPSPRDKRQSRMPSSA